MSLKTSQVEVMMKTEALTHCRWEIQIYKTNKWHLKLRRPQTMDCLQNLKWTVTPSQYPIKVSNLRQLNLLFSPLSDNSVHLAAWHQIFKGDCLFSLTPHMQFVSKLCQLAHQTTISRKLGKKIIHPESVHLHNCHSKWGQVICHLVYDDSLITLLGFCLYLH